MPKASGCRDVLILNRFIGAPRRAMVDKSLAGGSKHRPAAPMMHEARVMQKGHLARFYSVFSTSFACATRNFSGYRPDFSAFRLAAVLRETQLF